MIDRTEFARAMAAFADRIGRALAPATAEAYYETLSEALTTEEFLAGARVVFRAHQFNTWPAPQQFIDAVKPPTEPKLAAAEAFERVLVAVGSIYDPPAARAARLGALGPVVDRAYRAAGGFREFASVLEKDLPFLRARFIEAYVGATTEEARRDTALAALDRGALDPRVHGLVRSTTAALTATGRDRALPAGDR